MDLLAVPLLALPLAIFAVAFVKHRATVSRLQEMFLAEMASRGFEVEGRGPWRAKGVHDGSVIRPVQQPLRRE